MIFRETPELHEGSDELTLITLCTNMSQTYNQIVLKQALDDDISIYPGEIEVNRKSINHFQMLIGDIILKNCSDLAFRDVFDSSMFDKLLKNFEKDGL